VVLSFVQFRSLQLNSRFRALDNGLEEFSSKKPAAASQIHNQSSSDLASAQNLQYARCRLKRKSAVTDVVDKCEIFLVVLYQDQYQLLPFTIAVICSIRLERQAGTDFGFQSLQDIQASASHSAASKATL
jgi:hypothetical protein